MASQPIGIPSLTMELPLTPQYSDENVSITGETVTATLDLSGVPRIFESAAKSVGTYKGLEVRAKLVFRYDYDRDENKLTIRGNDDKSVDQLSIVTFLPSPAEILHNQSPALAYYHEPNDVGQNRPALNMWADHVANHPQLSVALSDTARNCNDAITKAAIDAGISSVLKLGTAPIVTLDNLNDFKLMFGEPILAESSGDKAAEVARMQLKVFSTYVGTVTWSSKTTFANVIGSTDDPKPSGTTSWLELWANKCNSGHDTTHCSSYNYFSNDKSKKCSDVMVGGHVITGTTAKKMAKGSTVYIFPICNVHNGSDNDSMESLYNPDGVQLKYW